MRSIAVVFLFVLAAAVFPFHNAVARQNSTHTAASVPAVMTSSKISIDGRLNEDAWMQALPNTGFRQKDPDEGNPVTEKTQVRVLYDSRSLYIGAELFDSDPTGIVARPSRRDDAQDSDNFQIYLDPYHDHTTGVLLQVSASGAQKDYSISNDTNQDISWDAVWDAAVTRNELGWFLEIRIPFSQLRFANDDHHTWGINFARFIHRKNETAWFELVPKKENGLASRMAHLIGLDGVSSEHSLEVLPYIRSSAEFEPAIAGDPFHDGSRILGGSGVDLKYALSSNLTLNATMNPDFGQVEVDPATVNLSAYETFFQERRPFFTEGSQVFSNFGRLGNGGSGIVFPTYFYSRRIGRAPQGSASGDYVDRPDAATILAAARIGGKPAPGWTMGLLNAVTRAQYATVISGGQRSKVKIDPAANYLVARVLREFSSRGGVGMLYTGVRRQLDPSLQDINNRHADMIGADAYYYFDPKRVWAISGRMTGTHVAGTAADMDRVQRGPQRYYQRPDATHLRYDPTRTSIAGWAGGTSFTKNSGGWIMGTSIAGNSPGSDTNDAGNQTNSDLWGITTNFSWRQLAPDRFSRNRTLNLFRQVGWNFNNEIKNSYAQIDGNITFHNYWFLFGNVSVNPRVYDDRLTRGGPMARSDGAYNEFLGFSSDSRKSVNFGVNSGHSHNKFGYWSSNTNLNIGLKPVSSLNISIGPNFNRLHALFQYVTTVDDATAAATFGKRYVFAGLDQSTVGMTTRANWSLTPKISLQAYSQFLLSAGQYGGFKELEKPRTLPFLRYGDNIGTISHMDDQFTVDPDAGGPASAFTFSDPSFNFKSMRMNAVFRWEWKPGSTLFLVWTQSRSDNQYPGRLSPGRDLGALFGSPAQNVFLVKTSYWFNR